MKLKGVGCWVYWFHLVRLSVRPSVDIIVSALYLQQYLPDPFHIYTSYQETSEGVSRLKFVSKFKYLKLWQILKICNFDFVLFWFGIQYVSIVWVTMGRRRVSSERRRSCYSSLKICFGLMNDDIWRHGSWSIWDWVMACCLTRYLNQSWQDW